MCKYGADGDLSDFDFSLSRDILALEIAIRINTKRKVPFIGPG